MLFMDQNSSSEASVSHSLPLYSVGQRLVLMDENPDFDYPLDDNMVVAEPGEWCRHSDHPEGGYWEYKIVGKANACPEAFLTPWIEGQKYYHEVLPCHLEFKARKEKKMQKNEAQKLGLVPIDSVVVGKECFWFMADGSGVVKSVPVVIASNVVGTYEAPRVKIDHLLDGGGVRPGGFVNLSELFEKSPFLE